MSLDKPYLDVPGTTIFDAEQSRMGYWLNQFCMSLMKAENRARFKADERKYLDEWPMTEDQKLAVLSRDLNRCISLGGNIYFLAKIGATDGKSFQQMAGSMTGMTEEEYRDMMVKGGRSADGNRVVGEDGDAQAHHQPQGKGRPESGRLTWPTITSSVYTSHVPAIGAALDLGKYNEPYWQPLFAGLRGIEGMDQDNMPDVVFLVYNDHATAFSLEMIPTFAIGTAAEFQPADEGLGTAAGAEGHRPSGARLAHRAVGDPGRLRPDDRQQDGCRSRTHRSAVAAVRPARRVAGQGDSRSPSTSSSIRCPRAAAATSSAARSARRSSRSTSR
jgi:gallate dioxygenase